MNTIGILETYHGGSKMEFTENLKLTQFTENDITSWLGNYNNDMQKIDSAYGDLTTTTSVSSAEIKNLQDKVATLETTSATHTDQLSVNTSSIAANALEIQTLETRENAHYNSLTEQIDALSESGADNLDKIKVLQSNVQTIRDIAAVNTASISKMEIRIDAFESGTQNFEETTQQTLEDHTDRITELESGLTDTDARARKATIDAEHAVTTASVASAQVTMLNLALENVESDLDNAKTEIASNKETAKTNAANIVTLNASVANNTASISANQREIASLGTRVESLEVGGNASELTQRVDVLEAWKRSASTDITTARTTADSAKTVAENVQSQVSGIKSGASIPFSFGVDRQGNYGYIKVGADTVTPFSKGITDYGATQYSVMAQGGPSTMKPPIHSQYPKYAVYIMGSMEDAESLNIKWGYEASGGTRNFKSITKGEIPYTDAVEGVFYYRSEKKELLQNWNINNYSKKIIEYFWDFYGDETQLVIAKAPTSNCALYFTQNDIYYPTLLTIYITPDAIANDNKPAIVGY